MLLNHDKILVEEIIAKDKTFGGIYVPNQISLQIKKGIVRGVGPGRINMQGARDPIGVKINDTILYGAHAGMPVQWGKDGQEVKLFIMPEIEVLGIFEEGEE